MSLKHELAQRWVQQTAGAILRGNLPFGQTAAALADYRGIPATSLKELRGLRLSAVDFSFGDFGGLWIQECEFTDCKFNRVSLAGASDRGNIFHRCCFDGADLALAHLGIGMTSNYNLCSFSGTRVKKTGFLNPVFEQCTFDLKNTSGIDLGCSGFWDCSFQGKLEDVRLHGKYPYALQQEKNTPPVMTGLHNVDFSEAKLTFISLRDGCIVEEVKLPSIGTSFLYSRNTMIKSAKKISNHLSDQQRCAFLTVCKVSALHASAQDITFLCEGDLLALCDATSAHALFEALKQRFRLAGPYVISKP